MVAHDVVALGVDLTGTTAAAPVIVQMHIEDFPARFLQDLATQSQPPAQRPPQISSAAVVDLSAQPPLYQPVQRLLNVAMTQLNCNAPGSPRLDPTRIVSAGIVIRRVQRVNGVDNGPFEGWMRSPAGQYRWLPFDASTEDLDPDPAKRPQLYSGRSELDQQLAAIALASASAETTSPAFAAPPATCAILNRTVVYGMIPTASSDTSDAPPVKAATPTPAEIANQLPALLQAGTTNTILPGTKIDCRWMADDYVYAQFPPSNPSSAKNILAFQNFSTALRMLSTVFGAFNGTTEAKAILKVLNGYKVFVPVEVGHPSVIIIPSPMLMGDFYAQANTTLLDYVPPNPPTSTTPPVLPTITLPLTWESLSTNDAADLVAALVAALAPASQTLVLPRGRFQNATRLYALRMFFRVKSEDPNCPPQLVWTQYSGQFRIAAWYESGNRAHPPVPLPDPTDRNFLNALKPNCSFVVPAGLMGAMQGASMSGLMNGAAGGANLTIGWICGFSIPLITICAFFVLNLFLMLLNIVFFWLPMIKICIPFPEEE